MTVFVLKSASDNRIGQLMFANHPGDWPPAGPIDCIFGGGLASSDELSSPQQKFLLDHAYRELSAEVRYQDDTMVVTIDLGPGSQFVITANENGSVWLGSSDKITVSGTGFFL